jgi:hypothetical protein
LHQRRTGFQFLQRIRRIHHAAHADDRQLTVGLVMDAANHLSRSCAERLSAEPTLEIAISIGNLLPTDRRIRRNDAIGLRQFDRA